MKVVLDARTANEHFPGIGRYVVNLAEALAKMPEDISVTLLVNQSTRNHFQQLPNIPQVLCEDSTFSIKQQWSIPSVLRTIHPDIYHSTYYLMPYVTSTPTVISFYDLIPFLFPQYFSTLKRGMIFLAIKLALNKSNRIISISESTKNDLVRIFKIDPDRIVVAPLAAATQFKPQSTQQINNLRDKYSLPKRYVLYVGSNKPHKNLLMLVKAWQKLNNSRRSYVPKLVISGYWDKRYVEPDQYVKDMNLQNDVICLGQVSDIDLPVLYSGACLFVFPSCYEGFGLPVLEAMSCGTPVACSNTSSLPEVVGDTGGMYSPDNIDEMIDVIDQMLSNDLSRMAFGIKAQERAKTYTWEKNANITCDVYRRIL